MVRNVKVPLGKFACNGIKASLDSDIPAGVRVALRDFTRRVESERPPIGLPRLSEAAGAEPVLALDLPVDEHTWMVLEREAARQGATVSQLATHSVLVYLAELERLTPPDGAATV
ncbi:MAG: hypothetical protein QOF13_2328 [Solirubrobacterales bacterium]|nr:hypothetical protein [Solirubrobacterales bacterium]